MDVTSLSNSEVVYWASLLSERINEVERSLQQMTMQYNLLLSELKERNIPNELMDEVQPGPEDDDDESRWEGEGGKK